MSAPRPTASVGSPWSGQRALLVGILFAIATAYVSWFDYAALTAVFHPTQDAAGNLRFQVPGYANTVYPFTYAAVAVSFIGVALGIFWRERARMSRPLALLLALVVANLSSIGMVDAYEQVFVTLMFVSPGLHAAGAFGLQLYWSSAGAAASTTGGLVIVLAMVPWADRRNWPGVTLCLAVAAASFAVWFVTGFSEPSSGTAVAYSMNATSRIASQLALVAAVSPFDWVRRAARTLRALVPRHRSATAGAAATSPAPERPPTEAASTARSPRRSASRWGHGRSMADQTEER